MRKPKRAALIAALALMGCSHAAVVEQQGDSIEWHSPDEAAFSLSGFGWYAADHVYRRLPVHPDERLRPEVDELANDTAGGQLRFRTDSRKVWVRVTLSMASFMYHMPRTGQSGFDLYYGAPGSERYSKVARLEEGQTQYTAELLGRPDRAPTDIRLDFPLYNGVRKLEIGLDPGSRLEAPTPLAHANPVVIYGTSITQGAAASRPGMAWTNIVSRRLGVPFINLGFSGNGIGEPELARLIGAMPVTPSLIVFDYEANADDVPLESTLGKFIALVRAARPTTPILVLSRTPYALDFKEPGRLAKRLARRDFERALVARLKAAGDANISFYDGSTLFGDTDADECTVDGVHPDDLGFMRMATALEPVIAHCMQ